MIHHYAKEWRGHSAALKLCVSRALQSTHPIRRMARHHHAQAMHYFLTDYLAQRLTVRLYLPSKLLLSTVQSYNTKYVFPLLTGYNPLLSRRYGWKIRTLEFLDWSANRIIIFHRKRFNITWAVAKGLSMRCAFYTVFCFLPMFHNQKLCNEVCTCSKSNIGLRWNDQCAQLIWRNLPLDNTPVNLVVSAYALDTMTGMTTWVTTYRSPFYIKVGPAYLGTNINLH